MTMWGGRFTSRLDPAAWALNASIGFDQRLAEQDVRGSLAWAGALQQAGVLTSAEHSQIVHGLQQIGNQIRSGGFAIQPDDEDIHSAVERRLGELIGPLAGKLHTGRSRNDQVATDFRLWLLDNAKTLEQAIQALQAALLGRAETDMGILMPGYTHLQRAQPLLLSHWWLAYFWPLQRDRQRLAELTQRASSLPLGAGALAGAPLPIDRQALAEALGFAEAAPNSIDAVSDRDFAAEFLFCATMTGSHLSRLAEQVIVFCSAEFGFFELSDRYSTGSSLMPQKKNPDVFELARGKAGALLGLLTGLMATLKALPSSYDKDLQEDKPPVFSAFDTLMALLPALAGALETLQPNADRLRSSIDAAMLATDLADYLVESGLPFRQAHSLTGQAVQLALKLGKPLDQLSLDELQSISPAFGGDVDIVFNPERSVALRAALGGTAPKAVQAQLAAAKSTHLTLLIQ
jgi:argininosuccinate lyase